MSKPRILITNIASLNTGDAAILWGMQQMLRERYGEHCRITALDREAEAAQRCYPWAEFKPALFPSLQPGPLGRWLSRMGYRHRYERLRSRLLRLALRLHRRGLPWLARLLVSREDWDSFNSYAEADLIVSTGGTYLRENYSLASAIHGYEFALATGRPLVFFTQTLGPFRAPRNRQAFGKIFRQARAILVRDEPSRHHITELGVTDQHIHLCRDAAFALPPPEASPAPRANSPLRIAISVRSMSFFGGEDSTLQQRYEAAIAALAEEAVRNHGALVVFLSTCQGIPEYWTDDSRDAGLIVEQLSEAVRPHVQIDGQFRGPTEIVRAYADFDLVIATRMHAAILSMVAGVPILPIAYEFKQEELFGQLGLADVLLRVDQLQTEEAVQLLSNTLARLPSLRQRIAQLRPGLAQEARSAVAHLPDLG